jgi:hypothetical protein
MIIKITIKRHHPLMKESLSKDLSLQRPEGLC